MAKMDYDKISEVYDTVRHGDPAVIEYMLSRKAVGPTSEILEIGCGTGNNTILLEAVTKARIYGLDQSQGMLDKAVEKTARVEFILGDAVTLKNLPNDRFDIVYMVDVIHHIEDIGTMFTNIFRILKRNGAVFVFTDTHERIKSERLTSKYFPETIDAELKRYQSTEKIIEALKASDFRSIKLEHICETEEFEAGEKLIKLAEAKGYSMFHLISQEAIERGIERIRRDIEAGREICYMPRTPVFSGKK